MMPIVGNTALSGLPLRCGSRRDPMIFPFQFIDPIMLSERLPAMVTVSCGLGNRDR